MPKSNFNQFLDECEDFTTTAEKTSMRKISFETKLPCNDECESQPNQPNNQPNQNCDRHNDNHHNGVKTLNTFFSNSNSNARCGSGSSSSNAFLSKSANNGRDRFDRFSTNRTTTTNATTNVQTNIFKKMGDNNHCFNQIPTVTTSTTSTSMQIVEINNETFPSLTSAPVAAATTASSVSKNSKISKMQFVLQHHLRYHHLRQNKNKLGCFQLPQFLLRWL